MAKEAWGIVEEGLPVILQRKQPYAIEIKKAFPIDELGEPFQSCRLLMKWFLPRRQQ